MNSIDGLRIVRGIFVPLTAAAVMFGVAAPASAFVLYNRASCNPGQKWNTSNPVKVRVLGDSVFDYLNNWRGGSTLADLGRLDRDINAVIDLYNSIPGSSLKLELGPAITGDTNLDAPGQDDFGDQTIVIGFTKNRPTGPEAWMSPDPDDGCTRTRVHISFRKQFNWIFGPPDTTDVDGRAFYNAAQPNPVGNSSPRTFLGILTHEMGHAVGLGHPDDAYAVMAQNFRTWFRGPDHVLRTRLLPDDTAGVLALYGTGATKPLDVSVTATWYTPAEAQATTACAAQRAQVDEAARAVSQATGLPIDGGFPAEVIFKGEYADLFDALENAQEALRRCEEGENAMQIDYCTVSSRGDDWANRLGGSNVPCGVNSRGSTYAPVSATVCPGGQVQLRYSVNNHTSLRDVLVKAETWFSRDTRLNALDGSDLKSPDTRESTVRAASSTTIGQVFRLPASIPTGETLYVFVRAIPYDPATGASLMNSDVEPWNNAIMLRSAVTVDSAVCR